MRHMLSVEDIGREGLRHILDSARARERGGATGRIGGRGPLVALMLERPALRTRIAYEAAVWQLNGRLIPFEGPLASRESLADVARVLSQMVDAIVARVRDHETLEGFAGFATVPVVNALSNREHPVEVLADALTLQEVFGEPAGRKLAFVGAGGNVCHSVLLLAAMLGLHVAVATPPEHAPDPEILERTARWTDESGHRLEVLRSAEDAVRGADAIYTDAWPNIGDPDEQQRVFGPYRVDRRLLSCAAPEAIFLHCLPAHRGREVTDEVIDGPRSFAFRRLSHLAPTTAAAIEWLLDSPK
jgi:ornithine carbamoyltransferase